MCEQALLCQGSPATAASCVHSVFAVSPVRPLLSLASSRRPAPRNAALKNPYSNAHTGVTILWLKQSPLSHAQSFIGILILPCASWGANTSTEIFTVPCHRAPAVWCHISLLPARLLLSHIIHCLFSWIPISVGFEHHFKSINVSFHTFATEIENSFLCCLE